MRNFTVKDVLSALSKAPIKNNHIEVTDIGSISGRGFKLISGYSVFDGENAGGGYSRVVAHDRDGHALRYVHLNEHNELCLNGEAAPHLASVNPKIGLLASLAKYDTLSGTVIL